jgi:hypothetical protein
VSLLFSTAAVEEIKAFDLLSLTISSVSFSLDEGAQPNSEIKIPNPKIIFVVCIVVFIGL